MIARAVWKHVHNPGNAAVYALPILHRRPSQAGGESDRRNVEQQIRRTAKRRVQNHGILYRRIGDDVARAQARVASSRRIACERAARHIQPNRFARRRQRRVNNRQSQSFRHNLRGRGRAQKLASAARRRARPATGQCRFFERDFVMSISRADGLHFPGVFAVLGHESYSARHQHARQIMHSRKRHHHRRQSFVAGRDADHAFARRQGTNQPSEYDGRVISIRKRVEHARRPLGASIAWVGAAPANGIAPSAFNSRGRFRHKQADFPVTGVITERDRRSVRRAHAAVSAQNEHLFSKQPFRSPTHSGRLGHPKERARRQLQQHLRGDRQRSFRARSVRTHPINAVIARIDGFLRIHLLQIQLFAPLNSNSMPTQAGESPSARRLTAIYPGSFDPLTNGHLDVISRAVRLVDHLVVAILNNTQKQPLFSVEERSEMLRETTSNLSNVEIDSFSGLLVDYAGKRSAKAIIRGIRAISDYEIELQMALINRRLRPETETIFLMASEEYSFVSSRMVKEIITLEGDVSSFVPPLVAARLQRKVKR